MQLLFVVWEYLRRLVSGTYDPRDLLPIIGVLLAVYFAIALVGLCLDHIFSLFVVAANQ